MPRGCNSQPIENQPRQTSPHCDCTLIAPEQIPTSWSRIRNSLEQFPEGQNPLVAQGRNLVSPLGAGKHLGNLQLGKYRWAGGQISAKADSKAPWDSPTRFPGKQIPKSGAKASTQESAFSFSAWESAENCSKLHGYVLPVGNCEICHQFTSFPQNPRGPDSPRGN